MILGFDKEVKMSLNHTPSANRLHIGIFGQTNSGKSSFINALTGQEVSIVSDIAGTTTDPVYKPMEINPLGACVIIDTAGIGDKSELGAARLEKTMQAADKCDIAILFFADKKDLDENLDEGFDKNLPCKIDNTLDLYNYFKHKNIPVLCIVNKTDINDKAGEIANEILQKTSQRAVLTCTKSGEGMAEAKEKLVRLIPEDFGSQYITAALVKEEDTVLLVMPQDIQAPKGRLILPQVQTIRELLDKKCTVICTTADKMKNSLNVLKNPPKLIITDSQVFSYVYENKPQESMLTSFSVLFAAYKGDLPYYIEGAKYIDKLNENSKVLIAECCTHAPLTEDIGRVKLPNMLRKRFGDRLQIDIKSGTDFPENLTEYDLIIQCGACMFNRQYVLSRIERAKNQNIPMTNYGVVIAHLTGILDKIIMP